MKEFFFAVVFLGLFCLAAWIFVIEPTMANVGFVF